MREPPNVVWLEFIKLALGFLLIIVLTVLALAIGLGKVEMQSSYGLGEIVGALAVLSGQFALYAFTPAVKPDREG